MVLYNRYEPSIDIIVVANRYKVLMWYNKYELNTFTRKTEIKRVYKQLFII